MSTDQESAPQEPTRVMSVEKKLERSPRRLPLAIAWALVVSLVGSVACTWLVVFQFGFPGFIVLWPLGFLAGTVSRKITVAPSRTAAWCQVCGCVLQMLVAEVCWQRWEEAAGQAGWWASVLALGDFVLQAPLPVAVAIVCAAFGCSAAYSTAGRRYRLVREYID